MTAIFARSTIRQLAVVFAIVVLVTAVGCRKGGTTAKTAHEKIDACSLITKEEVHAIQSSPIKDTKGNDHSDGRFRISQCFYTAETFSKSVSLAVTQKDPASPSGRDARDFWKETFGRHEAEAEREKEREKEKGKENEEDEADARKKQSLEEREEREGARPPKKLDGVGEEAYWTANRMGGALYVLKDDVYVRISVGGPEAEDAMIKRCKALAEKILSRL